MSEPRHTSVSVDDVRAAVEAQVVAFPDGEALDGLTAALVRLSVAAVATTLNNEDTRKYAEVALELGATPAQLAELILLVSAVGVHTLHEGGRIIASLLRESGLPQMSGPLDGGRVELRDRLIGEDPYWARLESRLPGFLDALLRLSPEGFEGFVEFCGIPWRTRELDAQTKELIYLALDSTPGHRYVPGALLHAENAGLLGAGRRKIRDVLDIAAQAGVHPGVA